MGTLVMLHGLTGTADLIRPFAESICPKGWHLCLPEGPFKHPKRGFGWWIRDAPPSTPLDTKTSEQVDKSIAYLEQIIPDGPLIVGGFSQGSALAQELLATSLNQRIIGVIVIAGKTARPLEQRLMLANIPPCRLLSMHGESDEMVPLWQGDQTVEIHQEAGWDVSLLRHQKGHMVNLKQLPEIIEWVSKTIG
ncbi:MAG: alpha/beta fold hydrolase [Candidatus Thalassarchaeaceae archaeon]|jgi:predicted esterase|nr:alpha/beta fold hydrolase [Candidatus Thalassarchaeaceae archaeon]